MESWQTVVALLSPAATPPAARSELKKLLLARNVRKTIADGIISRVFGGNGILAGPTISNEVLLGDEDGTSALVDFRSGVPIPAQEDVDIVYASGLLFANKKETDPSFFVDSQWQGSR